MASPRILEEVLRSTSDTLFPPELAERSEAIDGVDCDGETPLHVLMDGTTRRVLLLIGDRHETSTSPIRTTGSGGM